MSMLVVWWFHLKEQDSPLLIDDSYTIVEPFNGGQSTQWGSLSGSTSGL
jgi:hypothetical protein